MGGALTTWVNIEDVTAAKLGSPRYLAVIEWDAAVNVEVVKVATLADTATVPNDVAPSKNWTDPVTFGLEVIVAVKVTDEPKQAGLLFEVKIIVGVAWVTVKVPLT